MSGFESHPANYKHKQQILTNKRKIKFLFKLKIKEDIFKTQVLKVKEDIFKTQVLKIGLG